MDTNNTPIITDDHRSLVMTEIMTPNLANFGGKVHGGALLSLIDRVAYACACRYSGYYCVTKAFNHVTFESPVNVGELATFKACVIYTGNTSMDIGIKVEAENITNNTQHHAITCYVTMIAVDENKQPTPVKPLYINTPSEHKWHQNSMLRHKLHKNYHEQHAHLSQQSSRDSMPT